MIVGAPICHREWVIEDWLSHAVVALKHAGVSPSVLVVADPRDPSLVKLTKLCEARQIALRHVMVEDERNRDIRDWKPQRWQRMAYLRNQLLKGVRRLGPDLFLSLDSDILLHPESISNMIESLETRGWDCVGGKLYMTPNGRNAPSYAMFKRGSDGLVRPDSSNVMPVQVVMACKLMTPAAYSIDYDYHHLGEDIAWSKACRENGLKLGWDGRVVNKHVMNRDMLKEIDSRVGF